MERVKRDFGWHPLQQPADHRALVDAAVSEVQLSVSGTKAGGPRIARFRLTRASPRNTARRVRGRDIWAEVVAVGAGRDDTKPRRSDTLEEVAGYTIRI